MKEFEMTMIAIPLSDARLEQLRLRAEKTGLAPEAFLQQQVEQLLDQPDAEVQKAVAYVLKKNEELYRRLA